MSPLVAARLRIAAVLVVAVVVQTALADDMRVLQVAPDLMILVSVCAGLTGGTEAGAWVGFWSGLLYDMFLTTTPVGLSALTYCTVGAAVGALRASMLQERRTLLPLAALVGTGAGVVVFVAVGDILGQTQLAGGGRAWLIRVAVVEALWNAVLALPVGYIYAWASRGSAGTERLGLPAPSRGAGPAGVPGPGAGPR